MDVSCLNVDLSTPRMVSFTCPTQNTLNTARIIPKHKKSFSHINSLSLSSVPLSENKVLTALTPRKIAEAHYKQRDIYDYGFYLELEKNFKENLEMQEKRKKFEERKRKEEEFNALKEARIKLRQDEMKKDLDDLRREKEKLKVKQDVLVEKKRAENQFKQEKRGMFMEYTYIRRKQEWECRVKERELSLDTIRVKPNPIM